MPADTNPNGDIFGGWILSQMDLAGGTYAFHIAGGRVATVAITGMQFLKPVYVGDEISVYCETGELGKTSITVNIEAWVRRGGGGYIDKPHQEKAREEKVTEGFFTFVAIDTSGKPRVFDQ